MADRNRGVAPPDFKTPVGLVRLHVSDTDPTDINETDGTGTYLWASDAEIEALIAEYGGEPKRAAVHLLRLVAMTPAMQYKKWSSADLSVDGPAITNAIRAMIADIEKSIGADEANEVATMFKLVPTGAGNQTILTDADGRRRPDITFGII